MLRVVCDLLLDHVKVVDNFVEKFATAISILYAKMVVNFCIVMDEMKLVFGFKFVINYGGFVV